jgi:hypothetical protein
MRPALFARVALHGLSLDLGDLAGALDLWGCMWSSEEREGFETAVVRTLIDKHAPHMRLEAFALCHVLATPRLDQAAGRIAARGDFPAHVVRAVEDATRSLARVVSAAERARGNLRLVEGLVIDAVTGEIDAFGDALLDAVDVRDLVSVARTTIDSRLFSEVERRIARRGKYQRGRAKNLLGFRVPERYGTVAA